MDGAFGILVSCALVLLVFGGGSNGAGQLKWSPKPNGTGAGQGLMAFEGIEDDHANSDPGVKHIFVEGDHYRVNMPLKERDEHPDRQRNEVKGMVDTSDNIVPILKGETWQLLHSLCIPSSLKATTSFTHIMQLKDIAQDTNPILAMSLSKSGGASSIVIDIFGSKVQLGSADLEPLQNQWIKSSLTFTASKSGSVLWVLKDSNGKTVVSATKDKQPLYQTGRVRSKWGIYRSIHDTADLKTCYLLLKDFRASKLS